MARALHGSRAMADNNPHWWNNEHTSTWDRVKAALRRDWEQTKADVSSHHGAELNQGVADTVKQAVGTAPVPPGNQPIADDKWEDVEVGHRYGVGARQHHGATDPDWNDRVEAKLKTEWQDLKSGRTW
ncbi:MAG TPA: hypothetical protein VGC42_25610, partial [Kofleriaceae bacterium]